MRIQDIRHRRQELQAQLFKLLELRSSIGASIVRELSSLADEEDQILDHWHGTSTAVNQRGASH
jgi:hypothetical protein